MRRKKEEPIQEEEYPSDSHSRGSPVLDDDIIEPATKSKRGPFALLPTPVKFEDINKECKNVIGTVELFDGFRFEFNKTISDEPTFGISHSIGMGSVLEPASYNLGTNFLFSKTGMLSGRVDTDGHVMGRFQQDLTTNTSLKVSAQASPEPHSSAVHMEVEYKGSYWLGNVKWGNPGIYGISYMQSVTPSLSIGLDTFYHHKQAMSLLTAGFRYDTPTSTTTGMMTTGHIVSSYVYKIGQRVNLATELTLGFPTGSLETSSSFGVDYMLRTSHIKCHVDTNWKVSCYLEEMLNQYTRFMLCGELDHKKKSYRFGFGVTMAM